VKKAESEDVDIAGWVCKTMDLLPTTPTRVAPNFWETRCCGRTAWWQCCSWQLLWCYGACSSEQWVD